MKTQVVLGAQGSSGLFALYICFCNSRSHHLSPLESEVKGEEGLSLADWIKGNLACISHICSSRIALELVKSIFITGWQMRLKVRKLKWKNVAILTEGRFRAGVRLFWSLTYSFSSYFLMVSRQFSALWRRWSPSLPSPIFFSSFPTFAFILPEVPILSCLLMYLSTFCIIVKSAFWARFVCYIYCRMSPAQSRAWHTAITSLWNVSASTCLNTDLGAWSRACDAFGWPTCLPHHICSSFSSGIGRRWP